MRQPGRGTTAQPVRRPRSQRSRLCLENVHWSRWCELGVAADEAQEKQAEGSPEGLVAQARVQHLYVVNMDLLRNLAGLLFTCSQWGTIYEF